MPNRLMKFQRLACHGIRGQLVRPTVALEAVCDLLLLNLQVKRAAAISALRMLGKKQLKHF